MFNLRLIGLSVIFYIYSENIDCALTYTDIKNQKFNGTECGRNSLVLPGESCVNCLLLEAPISFLGYRLVVIHSEEKQRLIYEHMAKWGITEAVIGLRRIADSQLWWADETKIDYTATNIDRTIGTRTCFTISTLFPYESSWIEMDCSQLPKYYLYEWTMNFTDRTIKQQLNPVWYNESKPYLFHCDNNESISFAFECDQRVDCSDVSDELDCEYSNAECLVSPTGFEFNGIHRTMDLGIVCQRWERHYFHSHRYTHLAPNENFCRHSDTEQKPWCYSVNRNVRWGHCSIPMCNKSSHQCIRTENGIDYNGGKNTTASGLTCQRWDSDYPHKHSYHSLDEQENYCRNKGDKSKPWCFTTDASVQWEFCDLPPCGVVQCPLGYIECPSGVCIPLQKAFDGISDCPNEEDEINCGKFTCPGMFRCRGTPVCLSLNYVCDSVPDCPNGDDEILCDFTCPPQCICRGLSYKCSSFPDYGISKYARTLDLNGLKIDILNINLKPYLNLDMLNLSNCGIAALNSSTPMTIFETLANLLILDLSHNNLTVIHPDIFKGLHHLKHLYLDGNFDLHTIMTDAFNFLGDMISLRISYTVLETIEVNAFSGLASLLILDLSNNKLHTLKKGVFNRLASLATLDITGNNIKISKDMFLGLTHLEILRTDSYDVCCMAPLTITGNPVVCTAQKLEVSSCENLIKSEVLRFFIWIIGCLALLGNICVLVYRLLYDKTRISRSYSVFIVTLSISDLFMGLYMIIIAAMDVKFRGIYIWNDNQWRGSTLCAVAGFFATTSSEVSAMLICLLALDRFIALKFPYSRLKFTVKTSVLLSLGSFILAMILAMVPFLPVSYFDGKFYSRSSVCIALPLTKDRPQGWQYSVAVFVGFNMVLFLVVGVSQILVYKDVKRTMSFANNKQLSVEVAVARSLAAVVMTDFFCWFPVGAMGILSLFGVDIPSEVYSWVIVFVLPINSALNPFLYTFSEVRKTRGSARGTSVNRNSKGSVRSQTEIMTEREITNIALDFHHRMILKLRNLDISLEDYLQTSELSLKNLYNICIYTIRELVYLHSNQMIHGNLSEKEIRMVMNKKNVIDVNLHFNNRKASGDPAKDIFDYGYLVKALIRMKRDNIITQL